MKLLIAPIHYLANAKDGSEYTRSYEYLKEISKDKSVEGDALVGYMDENKIGKIRIHKFWKKKPSFITTVSKLKFIYWVWRKASELYKSNNYDTIWHMGPFAIGETFSIFSLLNKVGRKFVIGPIYTPLKNIKTSDMGHYQKKENGVLGSISIKNKLDLLFYRLFAKICFPLSYLTLKKAREIFVIESETKRILDRLKLKNVTVAPLTIDPGKFNTRKRTLRSEKKLNLLSVGYLVERKRMQDIIEAVKILVSKFKVKNVELTIVGDGPQKEFLEKFISENKIGKYVRLAGFVPRASVSNYYKKSDIFISASLSESMPGVYFEAMAAGLPLVVTDTTTSNDLTNNKFGGYVVATKSPSNIAGSINKIIKSKHEYEKFSQRNIELMQTVYNFKKNINKLKDSLISNTQKIEKPQASLKFSRILLNIFIGLSVVLLLALGLRGNPGSPSIPDLLSPEWRENGPFELSPERGRFALTYSVVEKGTVFFPFEMARFSLPDVGYREGKYVSLFAPALSFIIVPGYILGKEIGNVQVGTFVVISFFAFVNFWLLYFISKKLGSGQIASLLTGFIFIFATPAFAYGVNLYQHHVTVFLILSSILLLLRSSHIVSYFFVFLLWSVGISLDYPNMFLFLPIGFAMLSKVFEFKTTKIHTTLKIKLKYILSVVGVVLPLLFFFWFNSQSYGGPLNMLGGSSLVTVQGIDEEGNPIAAPGKSEELLKQSTAEEDRQSTGLTYFKTRNLVNGLYIHLVSPDRGILFFAPVILFGIFGAIYLFKKQPSITVLLLSIAIANLGLYSMWGDPWGGWAFGSRYLIPTYSIMAIFIGSFINNIRKSILILAAFLLVCGYSMYVNAAGALSTSANPPQVQILSLESITGRRERYSFDRNVEYLKNNRSKSFIYQTYFDDRISAWQYFQLVTGVSITITFLLLTLSYISYRKQNYD